MPEQIAVGEPTVFSQTDSTPIREGLAYNSVDSFCRGDPYESTKWRHTEVSLRTPEGDYVTEVVEVPESWSDQAATVVAQKYFRGHTGTPARETSVRQIVRRVVDTITQWAEDGDYFDSPGDLQRWSNDLTWLLLHQHGAFNSPVWFNLGVPDTQQQASGCFIQNVEDNMESIAGLQTNETAIFKLGSGTGTNYSKLRGSCEPLSGGGRASGPLSFMKGYDRWAGQIKSGGKTRRAAKMAILNIDHPDIMEFIQAKVKAEKVAHALIDAGWSSRFNDPEGAYSIVDFQNANHSIRVSDDFMKKVVLAKCEGKDLDWELKSRVTGETVKTIKVLELWNAVCEAVHFCGDPGIQFDTPINEWHTCAADGRIDGSNPCGEYMFLDDSACNLASLNLRKFEGADGTIDSTKLAKAVNVFVIAQEAIVSHAFYPTDKITENSARYRPLGLGYANLGAHLMSRGLPYDSDQARHVARQVTSHMTAQAYLTSANLASAVGPFERYKVNARFMLDVVRKHYSAAQTHSVAVAKWDEALEQGQRHGFRNAQVTLLAPTGTIAFMMDCDTTGCEPDFLLSKVKNLAGGGSMVIVNQSVKDSLTTLGYGEPEILDILAAVKQGSIFNSKCLLPSHYPVFACAVGDNPLSIAAHIKMTATIQPFVSGAISKTVNAPKDITADQISEAYILAWDLGGKAVSLYRDGAKMHQPLESSANKQEQPSNGKCSCGCNGKPCKKHAKEQSEREWHQRRPLPDPRQSITKKIEFGNVEAYLTVSMYPDGTPGEIFIKGHKEGGLLSGMTDSFAIAFSLALQHGCPLRVLLDKFRDRRFEPSGWTSDGGYAKSFVDYVATWMEEWFVNKPAREEAEAKGEETPPVKSRLPSPSGEWGTTAGDKTPMAFVASMLKQQTRNAEVQQTLGLSNDVRPELDFCQCGGYMMPIGPNCTACSSCGSSEGGCG